MKKEVRFVTHGNLELLEAKLNEALEHGWNLLGYINFLDGRWVMTITRTFDE